MVDRMGFLQAEIDSLKKRGIYAPFRVLHSPQMAESIIDGKKVINLCSNNYLGLTNHPKIKEAEHKAIDKWGAGAGAVRPIIGTMQIHIELEERLAKFKGTESSLVFIAGIAANRGTIQALIPEPEDAAISDELNHASIIDGVRLTKAKRFIYKHNDMNSLEDVLKQAKGSRRIMIITDGVFSMDGDIAPLPQIAELADKYGAFTMVDDAHASGVLGKGGRGTVSHFNLEGRWDIQMGTLSKGMGVLGGYIAGTKNLTDFLRYNARPFLFSTAHPPATAAGCIAAIDILESPEGEALTKKLWDNTHYFKGKLKELGFDLGKSVTPITPLIIGGEERTAKFSKKLFEEGVMGTPIFYPTVARGTERIRFIVTAMHTKENLDFAIEKIEKVAREFKVI
ncbi:MAG: glycine C-acetyltransferase [Planctomycetota bacterium]|nr:glycine C-acetyltransferase [Planctomycetota bacterium]